MSIWEAQFLKIGPSIKKDEGGKQFRRRNRGALLVEGKPTETSKFLDLRDKTKKNTDRSLAGPSDRETFRGKVTVKKKTGGELRVRKSSTFQVRREWTPQ